MLNTKRNKIILIAILAAIAIASFYVASRIIMSNGGMSTITVVNEQGKPIYGASIQYSGTDEWLNMGITDQLGHIRLSEVPGQTVTYQASYNGFTVIGISSGSGCTITLPTSVS